MRKQKGIKHTMLRGAARAALLLVVLTSVLVSTASAATTSSCALNLTNEPALQANICLTWSGLLPIAIIAVLLSFSIAAFIFVIGAAIGNDRIRNFGVGELYEAMATAITVGLFLYIAGLLIQTIPSNLLTGLSSNISGVPTTTTITDPYVIAMQSILTTINTTETAYDCLLNGYPAYGDTKIQNPNCPYSSYQNAGDSANSFAVESWWVSQAPNIEYPGVPTGYLTLAITTAKFILSYETYILPESVVGSFLIDALYILWGEFYLLVFFSYVSPLFIAAGVIFRALLPTRAFGGMLIALGIGFYIVAPLLFAFLYSSGINPYGNAISTNPCEVVANPATMPEICGAAGIGGNNGVFAVVNGLWLQILFYPILIIAITYTFVTQFANMIGATASMGGRLRVGFI